MTDISAIRELGVIAGRGVYPRELAESARKQGVTRIFAVAFKKETDPIIERVADEVCWVHLGQLQALLDAFVESGVRHVVMAGQIAPKHLFRIRMDKALLALLAKLRERNAHTIFGAIGEALNEKGIELHDACLFMESALTPAGLLTGAPLTEQQQSDVALGLRAAKLSSGLDIGQTVAIKEGTILAVEAFEGTDKMIERAGALGGSGSVVVKVAKRGHDMRFDIPVIGDRTIRKLKKAGVSVLAIEAGRTLILDRARVLAQAEKLGITIVGLAFERE